MACSVVFTAGIGAIEVADILPLFRCGHGCSVCLCDRMAGFNSETCVFFASALCIEDLNVVVVSIAMLRGKIFVVSLSVHELQIFASLAANFQHHFALETRHILLIHFELEFLRRLQFL